MPRRLLRTARHEAAHAVIGHVLGMRVKSLSIGADGGLTKFDRRFNHAATPQVVMLLAGSVVERPRKSPAPRLVISGDKTDGDFAALLRCGLFRKPRSRMEYAEWEIFEMATRWYVWRCRAAIERVARALLRGDLNREQFLKAAQR